MGDTVLLVLAVTAIPLVSVVIGAFLATSIRLGEVTTSAIQHLAAGLVFAAVSIELVPDMIRGSYFLPVVLGFALGATVMFSLEWFLEKLESSKDEGSQQPTSLLGAVALDLIVDGFLIGVGFTADIKTGILLTVALTLEILFLGLSCATAMQAAGASRKRTILTISGLGTLIVIAAILGTWLLSGLSGGWHVGVASFGAAALLYLVAEELLVRAHQVRDTKRASAMFFAGFLAIIVIDMVLLAPSGGSEQSQPEKTKQTSVPDRSA